MTNHSLVCVHLLNLIEQAHGVDLSHPSVVIRDSKVITMNRIARKSGVKAGTSLESLRTFIPDVKIIEYDANAVQSCRQIALNLFVELSNEVELVGSNLIFLLLPTAVSLEQTAWMMADNLRQHSLESAIGVAAGRSASMIACRLSSVSRQTVSVLPLPLRESLADLPLTLLTPRFTHHVKRCQLMGWRTFGDIACLSLQQLKSILGKDAVELWALSHGHDLQKINPNYPPMQMEWKGSLPSEINIATLRSLSKQIAKKMYHSLQKESAEAYQLCLSLTWGEFKQAHELLMQNSTLEVKILESQLNHLWDQMLCSLQQSDLEYWEESLWNVRVYWKRAGCAKQLSLETALGDDSMQLVLHSIERLNRRYGKVVTTLSDMSVNWGAKMRDFYRENNLVVYDFREVLRVNRQIGK